ncbi:hypothetical protein [Kingella kingae]|uniref:hypothetical protein n=1 Tax=Kingella kingae TaxID=504 RepID=UPI00041D2A5D|nr:hypothetical protein [Kingella kingae]
MPDLSLDKLRHLANILTTFNQKHLTEKDPIHSVTLPDGERRTNPNSTILRKWHNRVFVSQTVQQPFFP